jgi:hypothetical protein
MSSTSSPGRAKLCLDVALLGELRGLQRLVAAREIGAGILPVAIQEQAVEPAVEVVMVGHVALRARCWVVLVEAPPQIGQSHAQPGDRMAVRLRHHVHAEHVEQLVDRAVERHQRAVHVVFGEMQRGIEHQPAHRAAVEQRHAALRPVLGAGIGGHPLVRPSHGQPAVTNETPQNRIEYRVHGPVDIVDTTMTLLWPMQIRFVKASVRQPTDRLPCGGDQAGDSG